MVTRFESTTLANPDAAPHPAVSEFALGVEGAQQPSPAVTAVAARIVQAAMARTVDPEFSVDVDGALSFILRLTDGRLVMGELSPDGVIDASRYDDDRGANEKYLRQATEADLIALL